MNNGDVRKLYSFLEFQDEKYYKRDIKRGIPPKGNILIKKESEPNVGAGKWTIYLPVIHGYPPLKKYELPPNLFLELYRPYALSFDFMNYTHNAIIVSKEMLKFLNNFVLLGLENSFSVASLTVLNRKNAVVQTRKKYYLIWFYRFDNFYEQGGIHPKFKQYMPNDEDPLCFGKKVNSIFDENNPKKPIRGKFYPNLKIKEGIERKSFVLQGCPFLLLFTEEIKNMIEENGFIGPPIYAMDEIHKAFIRPKVQCDGFISEQKSK